MQITIQISSEEDTKDIEKFLDDYPDTIIFATLEEVREELKAVSNQEFEIEELDKHGCGALYNDKMRIEFSSANLVV